jgi:ubiquinone/menaquinone biosynthesis C-methylase UbiE
MLYKKNAETSKEWEDYWSKQKKANSPVYNLIAEFYRKFIIKRTLNYFMKRYFQPGSKILHAGCGSGQVDTDVVKLFSVTALDISSNALKIYKKTNKNRGEAVLGSIFKIPAKDESFDGIYNLGVMEHFTKGDIHKILLEFKRVLKPNGRLIIFWPPEFGATVIALKAVHFILNDILKRKAQLHPPEITRVKSRKHAKKIFEEAGFKVIKYSFSIRDLFTHSIIIAAKIKA